MKVTSTLDSYPINCDDLHSGWQRYLACDTDLLDDTNHMLRHVADRSGRACHYHACNNTQQTRAF